MTTIATEVANMNRVKEMLDKMERTPYWLARETGIPNKTIYALCDRDPLNIDEATYGVITKIAKVLGVHPEHLRSDESE